MLSVISFGVNVSGRKLLIAESATSSLLSFPNHRRKKDLGSFDQRSQPLHLRFHSFDVFFFNFFVYLSCWLDLLDGWIDCCLFLFRWVFIWSMMEQVLAVFELWSEERLRQWLSDLWLWSIIYFYLKKKLSVCEQSMILKCIIGCIYYSYFIFIINILLQITLHLKLFLTDFFD